MNILHLNTYDIGGAGKASYRLHQNLIEGGINSQMLVLTKRNPNNQVFSTRRHDLRFTLQNIITNSWFRLRTNKIYYFQNIRNSLITEIKQLTCKIYQQPDVIVAHWISNFVTVEQLYQLSIETGAPLVWYLLDMAPLTGGCHYAWNCTGYMNQCGNCPALYSNNQYDLSYKNWKMKHDLIQKMNITIVPATSWLAEQAKKATIFKDKKINQIMISIDPNVFKPIPKKNARGKLGIAWTQKIIFFGTQSKETKRKGIFYLMESLNIFANSPDFDKNKILIITAGDISLIKSLLENQFNYHSLGILSNDKMLATAYQAADLFICPSIEDSGPMMINESIMCGTPVVSFEMGVAIDLVHTGKTGYRAKLKDSADLAQGIKYIMNLKPEQAKDMSKNCRDLAIKKCSPEIQLEAFNSLFESLL